MYCDSSLVFILDLKEYNVVQDLMSFGRLFHRSGPWCLIDLCASNIFGFVRWKLWELRVGYEWIDSFNVNILSNVEGSWLLKYLNIKTATWKVFMSAIFIVLSFLNKGSEFARYGAPLQIRRALFWSRRIGKIFVFAQFAQTVLQYVIYGSTMVLYNNNRVDWGRNNFNFEIIPTPFETQLVTWCKWLFQVRFSSNVNTKELRVLFIFNG